MDYVNSIEKENKNNDSHKSEKNPTSTVDLHTSSHEEKEYKGLGVSESKGMTPNSAKRKNSIEELDQIPNILKKKISSDVNNNNNLSENDEVIILGV